MESGAHLPKSIKAVAAALSALLMLFSFILVGNNSYAASKMSFRVTRTSTATLTVTITTTTPSPTPTDTPTPKPTDTPTPKPTHTPTPEPTDTPTATPTAQPTEGVTATLPTATSTPHGGATPRAGTPTPGTDQTPTSVAGSGVGDTPTATGNGNGGGTPPTNQPKSGSGSGLTLASFITGALIFLGIVSVLLVGLLVLRKRLLPSPTPKVNLPPSGAQPWQRVRPDSMHGDTPSEGEARTQPGTSATMAPTLALAPVATTNGLPPLGTAASPAGDNGWPPPPQPGFSPGNMGDLEAHPSIMSMIASEFIPQYMDTGVINHAPTIDNFQPTPNEMTTAANAGEASPSISSSPPDDSLTLTADNPGRSTERIKRPARPAPRLMKLEATESSAGIPPAPNEHKQSEQDIDKDSDEMVSLDDPFLRDMLNQFILQGKLAKEQSSEPQRKRKDH